LTIVPKKNCNVEHLRIQVQIQEGIPRLKERFHIRLQENLSTNSFEGKIQTHRSNNLFSGLPVACAGSMKQDKTVLIMHKFSLRNCAGALNYGKVNGIIMPKR